MRIDGSATSYWPLLKIIFKNQHSHRVACYFKGFSFLGHRYWYLTPPPLSKMCSRNICRMKYQINVMLIWFFFLFWSAWNASSTLIAQAFHARSSLWVWILSSPPCPGWDGYSSCPSNPGSHTDQPAGHTPIHMGHVSHQGGLYLQERPSCQGHSIGVLCWDMRIS